MDKGRIQRIYERLEASLLSETCTLEEAQYAVDKLRETYFRRKVNNLLSNMTIQEIAKEPNSF